MALTTPSTGPTSQSATIRLQAIALGMHVWIITLVICGTVFLSATGKMSSDAVAGILTGTLGFSGGAIATRQGSRAAEKQPQHERDY